MLVCQPGLFGVIIDKIRDCRRCRAYRNRSGDHEETFMKHNSQSYAQPEEQCHPSGIHSVFRVLAFILGPPFAISLRDASCPCSPSIAFRSPDFALRTTALLKHLAY